MGDELRQVTAGLGATFATLERRTAVMAELTAKVREALLGEEKHHVISASYRGETLVIIADSAAWSTHIRYAQQQLLEKLTAPSGERFSKLRVKVGQWPANQTVSDSAPP